MPFGAVHSPRRRRLSSALASGQSFMNPHPRAAQKGAGPSALSAKVENSDGACVLVSEQFHVEHLRVRVCCVLDLREGNRTLVFKPSGPVAINSLSWLSLQTLPKSDT